MALETYVLSLRLNVSQLLETYVLSLRLNVRQLLEWCED